MKKPSPQDILWIQLFSKRRESLGLPPLSISTRLHLAKHPMRKTYKKIALIDLQHAYRNFYIEMYQYYKNVYKTDIIPRKIGSTWKKLNNQQKMEWFANTSKSHPNYYKKQSLHTPELAGKHLLSLRRTQVQHTTPKTNNRTTEHLISPRPTQVQQTPILPTSYLWQYYLKMYKEYYSFLNQHGLMYYNFSVSPQTKGWRDLIDSLPDVSQISLPGFGSQ